MSILDPRFKYTSAHTTDVLATWKKFGFKPTTEAQRVARQRMIDAGSTTTRPPQSEDARSPDFSLRIHLRASGAR